MHDHDSTSSHLLTLSWMPSITWHTSDGESQSEDATTVKVLISSLFVNGTKRRKLADLGEPPQRGETGEVILRFRSAESITDWCDIRFDSRAQGDLFEHHVLAASGKRKLSQTSGPGSTASSRGSSPEGAPAGNSSGSTGSTSTSRRKGSEVNDADNQNDAPTKPGTDTKDTSASCNRSTTSTAPPDVPLLKSKILDNASAVKAKLASMPARWADAVRAAVRESQCGERFVNPLPGLLDGHADLKNETLRLLVEVCAGWESADAERSRRFKQEFSTLQASKSNEDLLRKQMEEERRELDAKLRTADLNAAAFQKTRQFLEKEATALRKRVADLERLVPGDLRETNAYLEAELASLRRRLCETWEGGHAERSEKQPRSRAHSQSSSGVPPLTPSATAKAIAELEGGPLEQCSGQDRDALKKKLLLKWHPDKQPSAVHGDLATKVMQELQNLKAWNA